MESDGGTMDATTAAAELAALGEDRAALAGRVVQPWWYDALLGLLVAGFLSSYATHDAWVISGALVLLLLGLRGLMALYRRITGVWVNGLRPGPTQRAVKVWFVVYALVVGVAAMFEFLLDVRGAMVVGGIVVGVAIAVISRWWTRIYVAELQGEL
ncbi:hypothetical protein E4P40_18380 [Blastococcus sp. CT_GayMR20]|uniref:hypothetical protein n=1 Tax=Blastococcus sp. CT_GayMR20 TaxID=2559609 RepID=UPI00107487D1|nr:hypothetical protein [Blastococcus sp. CT_GayMR20]TFV79079.1 hypothetical protein E4P40_18380 [Blastococcus sp. CT_GayMR20]